jgi:Mrp family chromosome partitioning ATPase
MKQEYDWVIFDGAPVDEYPDSIVLARQVDGVILVIQAENRGAEVAIRAKSNLERSCGTILGAVLNRRRHVIPEFIYKRL